MPVQNTNGKYVAGSDGQIYCFSDSRRAAKLPKPFRLESFTWGGDYPTVALIFDGKRKSQSVHTLVCAAFHGPKPSPKHEVRHLDGTRTNSVPTNLKWGTPGENEADKRRHGRVAEGSKQGCAKLNEEAVKILKIAIPKGLWNSTDAAKVFGVCPSTIRMAVSNKGWKHVV